MHKQGILVLAAAVYGASLFWTPHWICVSDLNLPYAAKRRKTFEVDTGVLMLQTKR